MSRESIFSVNFMKTQKPKEKECSIQSAPFPRKCEIPNEAHRRVMIGQKSTKFKKIVLTFELELGKWDHTDYAQFQAQKAEDC